MATFSYMATILFPKQKTKRETVINKIQINKILKETMNIYQNAVSFICNVVYENWNDIRTFDSNEKKNTVEHLIHNTKDNEATYNFDEMFPMFPSYFRRDAVAKVIGAVSSHYTNLENYQIRRKEAISNGLKFKEKPPVMNFKPNTMPTFYKDNMYIPFDDTNEIELKLYVNRTWKYVKLSLQEKDLKYLKNLKQKLSNPTLDFSYGRFHLRYAVEFKSNLQELPDIIKQKIMSVDLGINSDAVCSIMLSDGTIIGREFISFSTEKANLYTLINRKKRKQRESGNYKFAPQKKLDTKINGTNDNLSNQIAHKITALVVSYKVDVVVFEHLSDFKGKKSVKIHFWRKKRIINTVCSKLHTFGIHYAKVNPRYTSKLAFDGSGAVVRDKNNYSLCTFTTGKKYNCDLSASYNIGAIYFLREYISKFPQLEKVLPKATLRTYSNLISLHKTLNSNVLVAI